MQSKEKETEDVVVIRYYNVLFYLFFKKEIDDFKRQCLVRTIDAGEDIMMKHIQSWRVHHQITYKTKFIYRRDCKFRSNGMPVPILSVCPF